MQNNGKRGGPGRGQGPTPIKKGQKTVTVSLRLTAEQRKKLSKFGGAAWFRNVIDMWDGDIVGLAHELWAAAQLAPGEGIIDGAYRIECILVESGLMTHNADVTGLPPAQTVELPPNPAGGRSELT